MDNEILHFVVYFKILKYLTFIVVDINFCKISFRNIALLLMLGKLLKDKNLIN